MQRQSASLVRPWMLALVVACAIYPDYARGQFLKRFRSCTLPNERRAWVWQRTEQYCSAGRTLEYRRRSQPCVCQSGYYRDEETNNCYDARRCGQCDSSKHERFNSCANDCEAVCGKQVIQQCDKPCVPGCECKKGYIRKYKKGPCVPIHTCPPKCPAYMTFEMERERCPRICNVAREDGCSETNEGPGCACRKGFVLRAPFGTVRTRVWCIHESMCTFPDEEKGPARNQVGKGGKTFQRNGAATNDRFWAPSRGRHGLEEPMPKRNDEDLFFDDKGFPPLGNLANKGGQGLELGQTKLGRGDGEFAQGKVTLGNDKTWRWNRGQRGYQGSSPQKIDEDLFQDNKGFPPLGGLVQKKDQEFNFGQERIGFKGSRGGYGARTISKNNAWGWNNRPRGSESSAVKKSDKDLYLGADQFSNLGYRRYKPRQGFQLGQREVGLSGSYNDRYVGNTKGQYKQLVQGSSIARKRDGSYFHWKKFQGDQERMGLGGTGRERGQNFDMDDWLSGHQSTGAIPNFTSSPEDQEGLMPTKVVDDWTPDKGLLQKGGSSKGGLPPSLKGASDLPGVGLPVGTLPELPELGANGTPGGVPGLEIPTGNLSTMLDMLEAQVGSQNSGNEPGQIVILGHGGRGTKGGHLNSGTEKKKGAAQFSSNMKGLAGISTGASNLPGAGLGVGKLPELPKLSDNGVSLRLPGAEAPTGKASNILDMLEAQVGSQNNEPGQIEILGHGGIGTKVSNLRSVTSQKVSAADTTQQNKTLTARPLLQPAKHVPASVPSLPSLNEQKLSEQLTRQGSQIPHDNRAQLNATSWTQPNEPLSAIAEFQGGNAVIPPSEAPSAFKNQQPETTGFTGQNWLTHKGNTVQPSSIGWTEQLEPSSGYSQLQGGNDRYPSSGATLASNNQPESKGQGWQSSQSIAVEPGLAHQRQRIEPLGISLPTRETAIAPLSGPTVVSSNRQPESTDYLGYGWQTPKGNLEQPGVVEWTQQPSSGNLGFRRPKVPVPQRLPTVSYENKQRQNAFIGRDWETLQSNTAQPSAVEWTPPNKPSPKVSRIQGATGYVSLPGATVVSAKTRTQSPGFGSTAQGGVFEWTQQSKPPSRIVREIAAPFRLLDGSVAYSNQQREKTVYTPESWQTHQGSMGQPGLIDRTKNSESLSDISKRPTTMRSAYPLSPIASWTNKQPENADFTAQDGLPYNTAQRATVVFSNTDKANQQLKGKFTQTVQDSMAHVSATDSTQQNASFANFGEFPSETASATSSGVADAPINEVRSSTVEKIQGSERNHGSIKKPGALDLKEENMSLSKLLPNLEKETPSFPPPGGNASSRSNKNGIQDNMREDWHESKVKGTESDTVKGAHKNETLLRLEELHSDTSSHTLAAPVVASKSTSKMNDRLSGEDSKIPSGQKAQSVRTDIKHQDKQLAKDTGLLNVPVPLPAAAVSSKKEPNKGRDLRRPGSHTVQVIEGQTGTQSVNAGKETATILTNEKKTIGHQILSTGIQFGKTIFGGLSNMLPFGGLFQYSPPVANTEQMPIEAYPDVYGTYSVQGEPFFGETFIPFGYPTVYPTPYVPMTDTWGQPYGLPSDLQAQQEPGHESGVPASPTPVSNQSAQKKQAEVSKTEVKGAAGSGAEYKMTAGAVPVAKNYIFDGSSPDSS